MSSAGTWSRPGLPTPSRTLQVAKNLGLAGLQEHKTHPVDVVLMQAFDLLLVMESDHQEALRFQFP